MILLKLNLSVFKMYIKKLIKNQKKTSLQIQIVNLVYWLVSTSTRKRKQNNRTEDSQ